MDFSTRYERIKYCDFLKNDFLPEDYNESMEELEVESSSRYIKKVYFLGEVPSMNIKVIEIKHVSENDPRVSLARESFRIMEHYSYKRVLAIFYSENSDNYRLSLLTYYYELKGRRVIKIMSPPQRYSFYLGPNAKLYTPTKYLIEKGRIKNFKDLRDRFSIEVVNKEFYNKIALQFTKLVGGKRKIHNKEKIFKPLLKLPSTDDHIIFKEFGVRLIGRIIFTWFLKKKTSETGISLIPDSILSKKAVEDNINYYHSVLEKLFFEILNTPISERKEEFKDSEYNMIPFLNGGLFEPHEKDFYSPKYINILKIPNEWFKEFFDILETYNFTIDENNSIDIELSVDPEMLGRIFENLLAEINPVTEKSAQKATGSYYTPREIVDYMVDESLKYYLIEKTKIDKERITELLSYNKETPNLKQIEKEKIVDAIEELKIIDPACGSGAFPMGIMQKIVLILQKVDPDSSLWLNKQLEKISDNLLKKEIENELKNANLNYIRKLGIIKHSIYGIDVQQIAVEISKLRAFLSLIVDSKVDDDKENRGLKPLPNLDFKFICANTLIKLPKYLAPEEKIFLKNIGNLIEKYFSEYKSKEKIKEDIKELINNKINDEMNNIKNEVNRLLKTNPHANKKMKNDFKNKINEKSKKIIYQIELWESYKNIFSDKPVKFFEIKYFFPEVFQNGGFDIVIGNPPYGSELQESEKEWIKETYLFGTISDSASLFVERANELLKNGGNLIFIITFAITFNKKFSKTRKLLNEKFRRTEIYTFDRDSCRIFKSMSQSVSILKVFKKLKDPHSSEKEGILTSKFYRNTPKIDSIPVKNVDKFLFPKKARYSYPHRLPKIGNQINLNILSKILKNKDFIENLMVNNIGDSIWYRTSGNFWYNAFERKPYESSEIKSIKIRREYSDLFIIIINSNLFYWWMRIYGDGRHLNKDLLSNFPLPDNISNLNNKYSLLIKKAKVRFLGKLFSVFDNDQKKFNTRLIKGEIDLIDLILSKYIYGFSIVEFFHILNYDNTIRGGNKIPYELNEVLDKIISKKEKGEDTKAEEFQIDLMVYKLYNLTYDEIKIIDPEIEKKITREEWER